MSNKTFVVTIIIFIATIASIQAIASRGKPVVIATNLENLPMEIAGFTATEDFFSQSVYEELNADLHVYRHYHSRNGQQVDLYIGYYGTAKGGRTPHNPYACLPGAGWGILETKTIELKTERYPNGVKLNYILAQKGSIYDVVIHWYQANKTKILDSGIKQNVQRFLGKVFFNKNDGAFIRISVNSNLKSLGEAKKLTKFFSIKILNIIPNYWPIEKGRV